MARFSDVILEALELKTLVSIPRNDDIHKAFILGLSDSDKRKVPEEYDRQAKLAERRGDSFMNDVIEEMVQEQCTSLDEGQTHGIVSYLRSKECWKHILRRDLKFEELERVNPEIVNKEYVDVWEGIIGFTVKSGPDGKSKAESLVRAMIGDMPSQMLADNVIMSPQHFVKGFFDKKDPRLKRGTARWGNERRFEVVNNRYKRSFVGIFPKQGRPEIVSFGLASLKGTESSDISRDACLSFIYRKNPKNAYLKYYDFDVTLEGLRGNIEEGQ